MSHHLLKRWCDKKSPQSRPTQQLKLKCVKSSFKDVEHSKKINGGQPSLDTSFFVITPTFDFTSHVMKIRGKTCQTVDDWRQVELGDLRAVVPKIFVFVAFFNHHRWISMHRGWKTIQKVYVTFALEFNICLTLALIFPFTPSSILIKSSRLQIRMVHYCKFTLAIFNLYCLTLIFIEKIGFLYFSNSSSLIS